MRAGRSSRAVRAGPVAASAAWLDECYAFRAVGDQFGAANDGARRADSRLDAPRAAAMLVCVAALALWAALGVAHVTRPPGYFTKYTTAAARSDAELGARALDLSPLYLAFTRAVAAHGGATAVLRAQGMLHAATAVLVAATVALGAGLAWGVAAGAAAALYRPFLVYAGVLEPECLLLFVLAAALLLGELARRVADERTGRALAFGAGAVLGCAALGRPQWLLLAPLWGLAVAAGRRRRRVWAAATVIGGAALVVVAFLAQRVAAFGVPVIMNPGPVLYEGNRPGVLGAVGDAPELVKLAEAGVAGEADYAHVVYRTVAAAALGSQPDAAAANRYWSLLALEHVRAHPAEAVRTVVRKAVLALGPYELHDLPEAEEADRRLRSALPWGFGALLALAPLLAAVWRERREMLAAPLALAALAMGTQVVFYASARQRLPLALALLVAVPLALRRPADGAPDRRPTAIAAGGALFVVVTWVAAPVAVLREGEMSLGLGAAAGGGGENAAAWLDGRAWRPGERLAADHVLLAGEQWRRGDRRGVVSRLTPIASGALAAGPWVRARAALWLGRAPTAAGESALALRWSGTAIAAWPGSLDALALEEALRQPEHADLGCLGWRPPGVDPLSACFALGREVAAVAGPGAGARVAAPAFAVFPALAADLLR